ncbi:MAG TPA: type II toxin-antitoxin system RelE/ParE family toxin [Tepidisphaeraceae bacterium]|nr:type II toxin-antitoxin system RelE/ParE family toxin [Tepidisphaeraceae bacterium]
MVKVELAREARDQFDALPLPIKGRVANVLERLHKWPAVSGAKALTGELKGNYRIRTGDYRIIFHVSADKQTVTVWRIGYRRDVYD